MSEPRHYATAGRKSGRQRYVIGGCVVLAFAPAITAFFFYKFNNRPVHLSIPSPVAPNPNAYDDFLRAAGLAVAAKHQSPLSMAQTQPTFTDYELAAIDAAPALAVLRQGLSRQCLAPTVRSSKQNGQFRSYSALRGLARTLAGVAMYEEMRGRPPEATEARLDGLEMAVMMPRGGLLIDALVGAACEAIAESQFEYSLPLLTEPQLAHVAARLDRIAAKRVKFAEIVKEEGYYQSASDMELMNDPKGYQNFNAVRDMLAEDDFSAPGTIKKKPLTLKQDLDAASFLFADKSRILEENRRYNDAVAAEASLPYRSSSTVPVPKNLLAQLRKGLLPETRARWTAMDAVLSVLRTETAVYRYKALRGHFPESLSDLTPSLLSANAAQDPFGGALKYRSLDHGSRFELYSVGPDLTDDHGTSARFAGSTGGDIVAGKISRRRAAPIKPGSK